MADIKDRAKEYLAKHSEYSEVFGHTFVAVDTMTAMVDFAEQETKELEKENAKLIGKIAFLENDLNNAKAQIEKMKCCQNCKHCSEIISYKVLGGKEISKICSDGHYVCDKWEIKEK